MQTEWGSSVPSPRHPFRRNHPARRHLKMSSVSDAPVVPAARKTGVFAVPVPKEMHRTQVLQLQNTPLHMDSTNTLLPLHLGKFIRTTSNIMSFNGVF